MAWSLVCPANRGIGFYLTRHLLQNTQLPVVATSRKDVEGTKRSILTDLDVDPKRLTVLEVDVTNESTISSAAEKCSSLFPPSTHHLRLAFSIPGILYPEKSPAQLDQSQIQHTFAVNTIGPLLLTKHFSPFLPPKRLDLPSFPRTENLPPHSVWLNMSARVGSTSDNTLGGWYSYRASKAAVNSLTKTFDNFLKMRHGDNALAISYHPGTVKTGLSKDFWGGVKEGKLFSPEFAVEKMWDVATTKGIESRGRCWDWRGVEILP
ncbi:2eedbe73-07d0-45f4-a46c-c0efc9ed6bdc [Sclerotinia trifoliorum]|uniref:2eedbe73-07d0-45f4-a46c-c0efc9ed6bdc n=1 Tax=Sclerotinia trifoliorum TaxID=28548 RepID=A0A8H2ZNI4_9HELO|nr:2eedbe73-07d0-45f4-a46c-c0efc9ed6bdc [Sclerotinia trifoliorum]